MRVQSSELPSYKSRSYHSSLASIKITPQISPVMAEDRQKSGRMNLDDGLRNYEKSYRQKQMYGEYKNERLMTDEIIPSFREKYEVYELLQEISESKRTIDIKNKEIFYLSNQLVSVKDEYMQKTLQLESLLSQLKREVTDLRFNGIKIKKEETQKSAKLISQIKSSHELELYNIKMQNDQILQKLGEQHKKQVENMEQKYRSILGLQKRQKLGVIEVWEQKGRNNEIFVNDIKQENVKLRATKEQLWEQKNSISKTLQQVKDSFEELKQKSANQQSLSKSQIQALKESLQKQQSTNQLLQQQINRIQSNHKSQIENLQEHISIHKQQQNKLKQLILSKDKSLQKLEQKSVVHHEQKPQIDPIRVCHHNGLILQLERNLAIKEKQNIDLRGQLEEWGKHIGFEKGTHSRLGGLIEVSSEALQVQQSFSSSLRRMGKKMGV